MCDFLLALCQWRGANMHARVPCGQCCHVCATAGERVWFGEFCVKTEELGRAVRVDAGTDAGGTGREGAELQLGGYDPESVPSA